jgi:DNA-binding FrmR family transcriptional regulator
LPPLYNHSQDNGTKQVFILDKYPIGVYGINKRLTMEDKKNYKDKHEAIRRRINIIKGQLDGLMKMIEKDEYCVDLLSQSLAVQNSLKSLDGLILERHLRTHVANQFKNQKEKAIKELLRVFKQSSRNR